jgi:hypothetical protein
VKAVVDQVVERADAPKLVAQGHVMAEADDASEQLVKCLVVTERCRWVTQ